MSKNMVIQMNVIDPANEALLETFIHETETMLDQLDEILLESEREGALSEENINNIFRITHTIKGSAAMMGFDGISNLSHAIEDVFYVLRENPSSLSLVFDTLFDLILSSSDLLKSELEALQNNEDYHESDPSELIEQLHLQANILNGTTPSTVSFKKNSQNAETLPLQDGMRRIRVFFQDGCQMEHMRAFMLLSQLKNVCEILDSIPSHPENDSSLCAELIEHGFLVLCKPKNSIDEVMQQLEHALNVKSFELLEDEPPKASPQPSDEVPDHHTEKSTNSPAASAKPKKQSLISVNQEKLDQLMDLVGEMVTAESMVFHNPDLNGLKLDSFHKSARELRKLTDELQDIAMSMRMVPLQTTFQKMERIVRDMNKKLGKKVVLITEGGDTEIDKTINDALADPFMHMIRNSMDHAIESPEERIALGKPPEGSVMLSARNAGGEIVIELSDDGCGLDKETLLKKARQNGLLTKPENQYSEKEIFHLIMLPGFSTNTQVTEFSGRGVGMDVVRKNIEQVGGSVSIHSIKHKGTTFTIKIPLTLAIINGMNLSVGNTIFTLPITSITQSFQVTNEKQVICNTDGSEMIMVRGECLPILRLHKMFDLSAKSVLLNDGILIQVESSHSKACIFADALLGEYQVVVKPFPNYLNAFGLKENGLSGCSILGNGAISLILDANNLLQD